MLQPIFRWPWGAAMAALLAFFIPVVTPAQDAQHPSPLTLQQAATIALEKNPQRKAALAETKAAAADIREARSFLLPHVAFSETATRGNDPVYVFGSKLRQHRFTTADFAPNLLNTPTPVAVQSDLLNAQVRLAARRQELIRAQDNLSLSHAELARAMGISADKEIEPVDTLTERSLPETSLEELEKQATEKRPDLKRIQSEEAAQQQSVAIAKSSFGPRVSAFADWEADNPTFVSGGGGNNWMAGIEVRMDLFEGGARRAKLQRERAMQEKVAALKTVATDAVRLEVRRAYYDFDAAQQQVEVAKAAIAQAEESLRITQNRYESGVTTIIDLLSAEEAASRSQTDYWQTVYRYQTSYANLELATGTLNTQSSVVTP